MTLNLTKATALEFNKRVYDYDVGAIIEALTGIETLKTGLGGLLIQPSTDGTTIKVKNAAGTVVLSYSTSKGELYIGGDIDDL